MYSAWVMPGRRQTAAIILIISVRLIPLIQFDSNRFQSVPAQVLDLQEFLDAVLRTFAPQAALLDAAERRHFVRDQAAVDADHARFDARADAPDARRVLAVQVGGEAEFG